MGKIVEIDRYVHTHRHTYTARMSLCGHVHIQAHSEEPSGRGRWVGESVGWWVGLGWVGWLGGWVAELA